LQKARKTLLKQTFILMVANHWSSFRIYEAEQIQWLEVPDLPKENAKVDELAWHVY
jgi:hypothetical protein